MGTSDFDRHSPLRGPKETEMDHQQFTKEWEAFLKALKGFSHGYKPMVLICERPEPDEVDDYPDFIWFLDNEALVLGKDDVDAVSAYLHYAALGVQDGAESHDLLPECDCDLGVSDTCQNPEHQEA
jgi:hypothetical protein